MMDNDKDQQDSGGFQLLGGEVRIWIEQEAIHIIAMDLPYHDPVELTADMARELAGKLVMLADQLDK